MSFGRNMNNNVKSNQCQRQRRDMYSFHEKLKLDLKVQTVKFHNFGPSFIYLSEISKI